ncbi:hypothetical protein MFLAVUS_002616 [Mucor flavus]|uniref:Uncharacterized protein n=1 Tax=Mucor flavus TaxID=439312 RepID=A0ABP9YQT1_9FUNG
MSQISFLIHSNPDAHYRQKMSNKRRSTSSASGAPMDAKKIRINGLSKNYKFLSWIETSLRKSSPELDYFSYAEQINDTKEATNTSYKDLLLTLQQKQSSKLTSIAHSAETTLMILFGSSQTTSVTSRFDSTSVDLPPSESFFSNLPPSNISNDENISKTLAQTANLVSVHVGPLNITDMALESGRGTLKANTTQEKYDHIMASIKPKEVQISDDAKKLIDDLKSTQNISSRNMRNALYKHGYNPDYNLVVDANTGIVENLTRHFLDLIDSPSNPLNKRTLERTAAVYTSIVIINQIFLASNDIVELGWLEQEYTRTNKTKWDGILFKTGQHCISSGFIEFSGGSNGASTSDKEHNDIMKLYSKMVDVLNVYPPHVNKEIFCMRYYDNTIFFEKLVLIQNSMF